MSDDMTGPGTSPQPQVPLGQQRIEKLVAAGVHPDEIQAWQAQKSQAMIEAGAKPQEIAAYWGNTTPHSPMLKDAIQASVPLEEGQRVASGPWEEFQAGIQGGASGMILNGGKPSLISNPKSNFFGSVVNVAGSAISDLPFSLAGGGAGFTGGAAVGAAVPGAGETGASELVGGTLGAGAGSAALPALVRNVALAYHKATGGNLTTKDLMDMALDLTKETVIGGLTAGAGKYGGGKILQVGGNKVLASFADAGIQASTNIAFHGVAAGRMPTEQDWAAGLVTMLGTHAVIHTVGGRLSPDASQTRVLHNMEEIYKETGLSPQQQAGLAAKHPEFRERLFTQDMNGDATPGVLRYTAPNEPPPPGETKPVSQHPDFGGNVDSLMGVMERIETGGLRNPEAATSNKGAEGRFQIMPGTARQYGFDPADARDPKKAPMMARTILSDLYRRANGNETAALVGYDAGPGRMNEYLTKGPGTKLEAVEDKSVHGGLRFIKVAADRDESFLPLETQKYLAKGRYFSGGGIERAPEGSGPALLSKPLMGQGPKEPGGYDPFEEPKPQEGGGGKGGGNGGEPPEEPPAEPGPLVPAPKGGELMIPQEEGSSGGSRFQRMSEDDAVKSIREMISDKDPGPDKLGLKGTVNELTRQYVTELAPAYRFDAAMEKLGAYQTTGKGGAKLADLEAGLVDHLRFVYGAKAQLSAVVNHGVIDGKTLTIKPDSPSWAGAAAAVKKAGGNNEGWEAYMMAQHALELAKAKIRPGAFDPNAVLSMVTDDGAIKKYEEGTRMLQGVNEGLLDYSVASGLKSPEQVAGMKKWATYLTIQREMDQPGGVGTGRGFIGAKDPIRSLEGGDQRWVDPLGATMRHAQAILVASNRNRAAGFLVKLAEEGKLGDGVISKVTDLKPLDYRDTLPAFVQDKSGGWQKQNPDGSWSSARPEDFNPEAAKDPLNPYEVVERRYGKLKGNEFTFFRNGKPEVWAAKDPDLAEMIRNVGAPEEADRLVNLVKAVSQVNRIMVTKNPIFHQGVYMMHEFQAFATSPTHPVPFISPMVAALKMAKSKDDMLGNFLAAGGGGGIMDSSIEQLRTNITKNAGMLEDTGALSNMWNVVTSPVHLAEAITTRENAASRMGVFTKAQDAGVSNLKAAMMARDSHLDYAEQAGGTIARALGKMAFFWHPAMVAKSNFWRAVGNKPASSIMYAMAGITSMSMAAAVASSLQDPNLPDDRKYENIPQWIKDTHIVLPEVNGVRMMLKVPPGLSEVFAGLPNRFVDWAKGNQPNFPEWGGSTLKNLTIDPFQALPAPAVPLAENWSNRSTFTGRPIVPASVQGNTGPYQYTQSTSETAKALDKAVGPVWSHATNTELSPMQIENLIRGWGGTYGQGALAAADAVLKPKGVGHKDWLDNPFFHSFLYRGGLSTQPIEDFYNEEKKFSMAHADYSSAMKRAQAGDPTALDDLQRTTSIQAVASVAWATSALGTMRTLASHIENDQTMTAEEKRQRIDDIASQAIQIAKAGSKMMHEANQQGAADNGQHQ